MAGARSRHVPDAVVLAVAVALVLVVWWADPVAGVRPRHLGPVRGWVEVVTDPAPLGGGSKLTVEVGGERFDVWAFGHVRSRLDAVQAGEYVWVVGARTALPGRGRRQALVRHVVGRLTVGSVGDVLPGSGLTRAGNRVRAALRRSADRSMAAADAALFTGLVIGDDARQPRWMVDRFRASGLSHLTAVSGQNVAFLLAAAGPLLRRLRTWWRWAATVALIGWFMSVTRFEPSVLRAGLMGMLAATAFALGRQPRPLRLVGLAVIVLVLADPLLVWSVGFWLSVGATVGVCAASPFWVARLPGPHWFRLAMGVTLGAQTGVAVPSLLVFHRLAAVSPLVNLAAVPVAGFVMLYGLPAGLVASWLPDAVCRLVMAPAVLGTRWTATVAAVGDHVEPHGWPALAWWTVTATLLATCALRRSPARPG